MESNWSYFRKQWLMILGFLLMTFFLFFLGLLFGYSVLGEGNHPLDILSTRTLKELIVIFH